MSKKEYIDRENYCANICRCSRELCDKEKCPIWQAPAADVREVVHARWLIVEYEFFTCSACGGSYYNGAESRAQAESYLNSGAAYAICPVCGAQMDLKPEA